MEALEGKCKYCGQIKIVMAESNTEADKLVTEKCDCLGAEFGLKLEALRENIIALTARGMCEEAGFKPLDDSTINLLVKVGEQIALGKIDKTQIAVEESTLSITRSLKGQIKVIRKTTKNINAEC